MNISQAGIDLIKQFEGMSLKAYRDSGGVLTIGFGHVRGVTEGQEITKEQAEDLLAADLAGTVEGVNRLVKVPISQCQFDALTSFAFNLGLGALAGSTLLKNVNSGDFSLAATRFIEWCHVNGQVIPGLIRRRTAEAQMFMGGNGNGSK